MKHFLSTEEISKEELEKLLVLAFEISKNPKKFKKALDDKIVATFFFEPSTRTRLSFESAILRVGAKVISTENANTSSSAAKSESIEDTARMLSGYADAFVMRNGDDDSAHRAARVSTIPVINGGSGSAQHPSQSLLDAFTIFKHKGRLDNLKICVLGDLKKGRTANSLVRLLSKFEGLQVFSFAPKGCEFNCEIPHTVVKSFDEIPHDVDVLYQTRFQRERHDGKNAVLPIIDKKVMERFSKDTLLLHPLPRNDEISTDVDDDPRALYFEQAHNGVFARMAILITLLGGKK
ncbi:MAG: aspartate carbamoyltransferase catalytic subunit [Firmicutes bacterium]|nr:aspartate carbamoyltransferase catalytic subunit [Bacillota bacterium]